MQDMHNHFPLVPAILKIYKFPAASSGADSPETCAAHQNGSAAGIHFTFSPVCSTYNE